MGEKPSTIALTFGGTPIKAVENVSFATEAIDDSRIVEQYKWSKTISYQVEVADASAWQLAEFIAECEREYKQYKQSFKNGNPRRFYGRNPT